MYGVGRGVPQDDVMAYVWINLAAAQGNEVARTNLDIAANQMTPDQLAEAQRLAREWKPTPARLKRNETVPQPVP
jgi:TPR repeat protein